MRPEEQIAARPLPPARSLLAFDEFRSTPCFAGLDILRGISILLVIWHHTVPPNALLSAFYHNSRHGVALFFIISGFLITSLLLRERAATGKIHLGRFYARRSLRLFPLYYLMLGVHAILVYVFGFYAPHNQAIFDAKLTSHLFYFSNWLESAGHGPFFQAWSLAAEEQFYLLFAAAVVFLKPRFMPAAILGVLVLKLAIFTAVPEIEIIWPVTRIVLSYQEPILLGVLLAYGLNNRRFYETAIGLLGSALPVACAGTAIVLVCLAGETYTGFEAQIIYALMTLLVGSFVVRRRVAFRCSDFFGHIGKVSYGIYLLHMLVVVAVRKVPFINDPYTCFVVTVVVVVPVATCVYDWFEVPIIRFYKKRFSGTRGAPGDTRPVLVPPVIVPGLPRG